MKPRALKFSVGAALCIFGGLTVVPGWAADEHPDAAPPGTPPALAGESPAVAATPLPATPAPVPGAKPKKLKSSLDAPKKVKAPKEIPFPLPVNESATGVKIPELGLAGQLMSQMMAAQATRLDDEHVQMHELRIDLYHPDGKEDFHILLPASVFNLKTHIITSEQPVTVKTEDFELTGERMEFNTIDREGKLLGHVSMHIHNLKQVAAEPTAVPAPHE